MDQKGICNVSGEKGNFVIRTAKKEDASIILKLIRELAEYEKMGDLVQNSTEMILENIFEKGFARALIAEEDGKAMGYAVYFFNYSTFTGAPGLYLEDIYIQPEFRKKGYGKQFFYKLAEIADKEGCKRMEWACLNWNKPSADFYRSLGGQSMDEWVVFRLAQKGIGDLALKSE